MKTHVLVATHARILRLDPARGSTTTGTGLASPPTAVAWDAFVSGRAWAGTRENGVFRSDDGGRRWQPAGLDGAHVTALRPSPALRGLVWAGTEPSQVWRSRDGGGTWVRMEGLEALPSAEEWSFPPRPHTHHVRWIAAHPRDAGRLWVAIEAGALVSTPDGGATWNDRVPGGPRDTHELALHPDRPDTLRVSAGDGYFESPDGGATWHSPGEGLEVGYLRSVAVDPGDAGSAVVSASSRARTAYAAGHSDGRLYRREGGGAWQRVTEGWPDPPTTIAPLLVSGVEAGELWAADERGVHRTRDGGRSWTRVATYPSTPDHLRGLAVASPRSYP